MTRWLGFRLCLSLSCLSFLARMIDAQDLQQSVAITLASGQYVSQFCPSMRSADLDRSTIESFQLTVPVVVQTATQVSMVTVTQMSMQTSTVSGIIHNSGVVIDVDLTGNVHGHADADGYRPRNMCSLNGTQSSSSSVCQYSCLFAENISSHLLFLPVLSR